MRWNYLLLYTDEKGNPETIETDDGQENVSRSSEEGQSLHEAINKLGFAGWELVTSMAVEQGHTLIFKMKHESAR